MSGNDNDSASDPDESDQPHFSSQHKDRLTASREKDIPRRESAVVDDEAAVLRREKSATAREDAAHLREKAADLREDAAHLREGAAQIREGEAHAREGVATLREGVIRAEDAAQAKRSEDRLRMMQDANAQLVISGIEAHKMTQQVETAKAQLDHLAHHDVLTGLPNRMLLQDRLSYAIELARRQGRQFAMLFMDLDRFKHINDSLGHAVGDQLLQSVARRLVRCMRHSDTVSRQGGDEFVVLLSTIKHPDDAAISAQKILTALAVPHLIGELELHVSVSIGISIYPDDGRDAEALTKSADTAMYHAKENGRDNYKFFEQAMNIRAVQRQSIEVGLRRALERQEFVLHYQPKINLHSNLIVGVEALIRWQHPERGLMPPLQFLPIAEDCGLILPIGRWVLREACLQAQAWIRIGLRPITIAVNTSALEFNATDFLENIRATLDDTGLEPRYLELELTESVLMRDAEFTDSILHGLADLGVKLAIDDFGTGYSSLSYLRQFPIDTLKIDQSFVSRITSSPDDATIVSAVINMSKSLKLRVIAEGVETPEQRTFLLAQHCDEGQGYYFSHPITAEALTTLLQTGIKPAPHI
ncbi:putative bifunctional diguanylate cyclase/phosphodiesterase [Nitrosospira briensis]|uniref:putative bifunctional diguanylate cyclase/phosphodiesterase n=1 Tax=Nitrosospira briensis TaxID=35799 RepID=UPI00046A3271|nr:EAL domain-containing protein [Nitrosospira briensis]